MNLPIVVTLGGHSALEICLGAKKLGFKTLVIVMLGRDKPYTHYFKNLVDEYITVTSFGELTGEEIISKLQKKKCLFIPHRYCQVYCDMQKLEKVFSVPTFGNKYLLKYEEREGPFNQYQLLYGASIPYPLQFKNPQEIDRLAIVKVKEKERGYERAFFFAANYSEFTKRSQELVKSGRIDRESIKNAVIEEYLIGAQVNFNFFYTPLGRKIELLGTDIRRQTNLDGLVRLPAWQQSEIINFIHPTYIETGHISVTVKESLLEQAFILAERLVEYAKDFLSPGIIGPFALQTAILPGPPKEKIVVYDLSLRIPGSPGSIFTPYSLYHYGHPVSFGERIAMEIKEAIKINKFKNLVT